MKYSHAPAISDELLNMFAFLLPGLNSRGTGSLAPGLGPIFQSSPSVADLNHSEETAP